MRRFSQIITAFLNLLTIFSIIPAYSGSMVDCELSLPFSKGGISIHSMLDQANLGRDSSEIMAFWTYDTDGVWQSVTRSGSNFPLFLGGGDSTLCGGPFGGLVKARVYDGISDYDVLDTSLNDSIVGGEGWWEIAFQTTETQLIEGTILQDWDLSTESGYAIYMNSSGKIVLMVLSGAGQSMGTLITSEAYNDGLYHVIRAQIYPTQIMLHVDSESDTVIFSSQTFDNGINIDIGRNGFYGARYFKGKIAYLAYFADTDPTQSEIDTLYKMLRENLDGTDSFASIQQAIDASPNLLKEVDGYRHISLGEGVYPESILIEEDSLKLLAKNGAILSGSKLPNGYNLVEIGNAKELRLSNLQILESPSSGLLFDGDSGSVYLENVLIADAANAGLRLTNGSSSKSLTTNLSTIASNKIGIYCDLSDTSDLLVESSVIAKNDSLGIWNNGAGQVNINSSLIWNDGSDSSGVVSFNDIIYLNPHFMNEGLLDFRMRSYSPALHSGSRGRSGWLGDQFTNRKLPLPAWSRRNWNQQ